jgi:hypothetical protein
VGDACLRGGARIRLIHRPCVDFINTRLVHHALLISNAAPEVAPRLIHWLARRLLALHGGHFLGRSFGINFRWLRWRRRRRFHRIGSVARD